jgi:hypothetical protein
MIPYFGDLMRSMDFVSFQAMASEPGQNAIDITADLRILRAYNPHLMISHYKPDNESVATMRADLQNIFQDDFVQRARQLGLFGFSLMDSNLLAIPDLAASATAAVRSYEDNTPACG